MDKIPVNYRDEVKIRFAQIEGQSRPNASALKYLMDIQEKYVYKGLNHMSCLSCILKTIQNFKRIISEWEK